MTDDRQADTAVQDERAQTRLALGALLVPVFFVVMFSICIIGVYHKPHPNGIKVGVVGPPAQTAPLRAGLQKAGRSAFDSRFDITTGAVINGPAAEPLRMYEVQEVDGSIRVRA